MASRTQFKEKPSQLAHPLRYVVRVLSPNLLQSRIAAPNCRITLLCLAKKEMLSIFIAEITLECSSLSTWAVEIKPVGRRSLALSCTFCHFFSSDVLCCQRLLWRQSSSPWRNPGNLDIVKMTRDSTGVYRLGFEQRSFLPCRGPKRCSCDDRELVVPRELVPFI